MSSLNKPITPPLHATNSWIITRARAMIDYDSYGSIEDWLENVDDDEDALKSLETVHPAGEIEDYDQDHQILTPISVVERLEAAAAKLEALHYRADEEQESDCEDALSMASSLSFRSGGYGHLPSDSLENEPLVPTRHDANLEAAVGEEKTLVPSSQITSDNSASSQVLAVPPRAYTARERQGKKANRQRGKRFTILRLKSYSDMDNLNEGLSIERGLSPIPRIRRWASSRRRSASRASSASVSSQRAPEPGPVSSEIVSTSEANVTQNTSSQSLTQSNSLRLRISKCRQTPSLEILSPIPQRAGQLLVPGPAQTHFIGSPFSGSKGSNVVRAPTLVIESGDDQDLY
ncbi:hypothetical protein NPX13_g9293 [Xylaria arbuscula]|uniref:Uncharacterized protein n=1 Tax=Xylaria arbuscula TaxID=114810 RepID=A0A9W8N6Z5_9PEZI|nr:hypothetical protein NPX13_g9293 [Xylaria arbuscula]